MLPAAVAAFSGNIATSEIVRCRLNGETLKKIASRFRLNVRTVRRIVKRKSNCKSNNSVNEMPKTEKLILMISILFRFQVLSFIINSFKFGFELLIGGNYGTLRSPQLSSIDLDRMKSYQNRLDFYHGSQWEGRAARNEKRLTFNYSRVFIDKITSYLMAGMSFAIDPENGADPSGAQRAGAALRRVFADNNLEQLDQETEIDCAILGDAAYKVTWDAAAKRVRVTAPDVQGIYVWLAGDDISTSSGSPPVTLLMPLLLKKITTSYPRVNLQYWSRSGPILSFSSTWTTR